MKIAPPELMALKSAVDNVESVERRLMMFADSAKVTVTQTNTGMPIVVIDKGVLLRQVLTLIRPELVRQLMEARDQMSACHDAYLNATVAESTQAKGVHDETD